MIFYTTLSYHLIKDIDIDFINRTFIRENAQYLACIEECAFFFHFWCIPELQFMVLPKFVMPLFIFWITLLLDLELNIMGKLLVFRWELIVLLLLQTFLLFYERDFMKYLSLENQANIIEAFNFSSRYLDDLFKYWQYLLWPNGGLHIPYWIPIVSSQFLRYRGTFFLNMYVYLLVQFSSKFMVN